MKSSNLVSVKSLNTTLQTQSMLPDILCGSGLIFFLFENLLVMIFFNFFRPFITKDEKIRPGGIKLRDENLQIFIGILQIY